MFDVSKLEALKEWEDILAEATAQVDAIKNEIKEEMVKEGKEEMVVGRFIVRYTSVLSNRFDTTAFKKVMPDVYKAYTKQVASRRFTVSE